jgi:spoIIIJ-associated protein
VKDWIFTGASVEEALTSASQTLGMPSVEIAHIILEAGRPSSPGHAAVAAKIAVLAENIRGDVAVIGERTGAPRALEPERLVRNALDALEKASGVEVKAELATNAQGMEISIECDDEEFLWGERGEVFDAINLLLGRALRSSGYRGNVRIAHQGVSRRRRSLIETLARDTAARAHDEGLPQVLTGLNSFERRIVHLTLQDRPDVWTKSEGVGDERRLIVGITITERGE